MSKPFKVLSFLLLALLCITCGSNSPSGPAPTSTKYGKLGITIVGLASHLTASVEVTGPGGYVAHIAGDTLLDSVAVGTYTVVSSAVVDTTGDTLTTTNPSQQIAVEENQTATANVIYQYVQSPGLGSISIHVSGLPDNDNDAQIDVRNGSSDHWTAPGTSVLDSLPPGDYTIVSAPVIPNGTDSMFATPDSVQVAVTADHTTNVTVTYRTGFSMKVFAQLNHGTLTGHIGAYVDGAYFDASPNNFDAATAQAYTNSSCRLVTVDVTNTGYTKTAAGSEAGGSLSATQTLVVDQGTVTLTTTSSVTAAVPSASQLGEISIIAETRTLPYILQFDNPFGDTVEVAFSWSISGSASGGGNDPSRAGAETQAWMHLPTTGCFTSINSTPSVVSFNAYYNHIGNNFIQGSPDTTIVFRSPFYIIGVDMQTKCLAHSFFEAPGGAHDGSGGGTGDISVTLTAVVTRH